MKIPTSRNRRALSDGDTMTSMIDIVFLLLIFFVCASIGSIRENILPTELSTGTVATTNAKPKDVWVTEIWVKLTSQANGSTVLTLNDRPFKSFDELVSQLRQLAEVTPDSPVILDNGPDVPWGDVIRAYDSCTMANFESIHFATDAGKNSRIGSQK